MRTYLTRWILTWTSILLSMKPESAWPSSTNLCLTSSGSLRH
ncbi:Protein of unknown function [Pyronema omphalodes CBS 100304]|uniref:Uncharacterized protein n=1 Tax=Pyronema omphalodes (strain CBS 100304) TaxID=1076935 RepID=U4L2B1_PYROM|nr:Protein of unknown function [Pyronema omphalodes CBS 100304]